MLIAIPILINVVSFPETTESYAIKSPFDKDGVVADPTIPILYVALPVAALQIAIVDKTGKESFTW